LIDAIPVALYEAFAFAVLPPTCAGGKVLMVSHATTNTPITVPAGTIVRRSSPSLEYRTLTDAVFPLGAGYAILYIGATLPGSTGNAPVGTGFVLDGGREAMTVTAQDRMTGGTDGESEADRKARFLEYVGSLSRSTVNSLRYTVGQAVVRYPDGTVGETVARVGLVEEAGRVTVYLYGSHGTASAALREAAQLAIDGDATTPGIRPAGVQVDVLPMSTQTVNAAFSVKMFAGKSGGTAQADAVKTAFSALLDVIRPGDVLYVEAMIDAALAVAGVERVLCDSNSNITCPQNIVLVMGAVTVQWI